MRETAAGTETGRPALVAGDDAVPLLETSVGGQLREAAARWPQRDAVLWADGDGLGRISFAALLL